MSNAQSALIAAATLGGGRGYYREDVLRAAKEFKKWLDEQDKADKDAKPKAPRIPRQVGFGGTND